MLSSQAEKLSQRNYLSKNRIKRASRRGAVGVSVMGMVAMFVSICAAPQSQATEYTDGLSASVTPAVVQPGGSFTLHVTDANTSGVQLDNYILTGLQTGWVVKDGTRTLTAVSTDPIYYRFPVADAQAGLITITPPAGYAGTLPAALTRPTQSPNLITDFDGGTFDYLGQANPQLPAGSTRYLYHDPTQLYHGSDGSCPTAQYGPCDGDYTIWPTANMQGPQTHYNNYWADIRSFTYPMTDPTTQQLCDGWNDTAPNYTGGGTLQVTAAQSEASGKIAVFNGSNQMSVPNDLLTTTVTRDLEPNSYYIFRADVANVSDDPRSNPILPVQTAAYYEESPGDEGELAGTSQELPKQDGCSVAADPEWEPQYALVKTGDVAQLTLGFRNFGEGGFGNDIALDNMTLYPMAKASFDLDAADQDPVLVVHKSSDPADGSTVPGGQTVTYTVTGKNDGNVALGNVTLTDDLSNVLLNATGPTNPTATISDGSTAANPTFSSATKKLTWTGSLAVGATVTLTYQVTTSTSVTEATTLTNAVTGSAVSALDSTRQATSNCQDGTEAGCTTTLNLGVANVVPSKLSDPPSGTWVALGSVVSYTVTAENTGTATASNALVEDDLSGVLDNATLNSGSLRATIDGQPVADPVLNQATGILTWTGSLAVGKSVVITYAVTVNDDIKGTASLDNVVARCVPDVDRICTTHNPIDNPSLQVTKVSNPAHNSTVVAGQPITYTVTGQNTGGVPLNNVSLTDDLSNVLLNTGTPTDLAASISDGSQAATPVFDSSTGKLSWSGTLPVGTTVTMTYKVTVKPDVALATTLTNKVIGSAEDPQNSNAKVDSNCKTGLESGCYTTLNLDVPPGLTVVKTSNPANGSKVPAGGVITYTVTGTNSGGVPLTDVLLKDNLSGVLNHAVPQDLTVTVNGSPVAMRTLSAADIVNGVLQLWSGSLQPTDQVVAVYTVKVNSDVTASDVLTNRVTGSATDPRDPDTDVPSTCKTGLEVGCFTTVTPGVPKLTVNKVSDPANDSTLAAGQTVTYSVTGKNDGNVALSNVLLTDDLSNVLLNTGRPTDLAASISDGSQAATPTFDSSTGKLSWSGSLPVGATVTVTYKVAVNITVPLATTLTNKVIGSAEDPQNSNAKVDSNCQTGTESGCYTTLNLHVPNMVYSKVSDPVSGSPVKPGSTITYTVTGTNNSDVPAPDAMVQDDLSQVLNHAQLSGSPSATVNGQLVAAPVLNDVTKMMTWTGSLAAGQSVVLTYKVVVDADAVSILKNIVQDCVPTDTTVCTTEHQVYNPRLTVVKVSDPVTGGPVYAGDTVTYTVTGENTGNVDLSPAELTDKLGDVLAHAMLVNSSLQATILNAGSTTAVATSAPTYNQATGEVIWSGPLAVGQKVTVTYQVTVNNDVTAGTVLKNRVIGTGKNVYDDEPPTSTCVTGDEVGCWSQLTVAPPIPVPSGGLVAGTSANPLALAALALLLAGGGAVAGAARVRIRLSRGKQ